MLTARTKGEQHTTDDELCCVCELALKSRLWAGRGLTVKHDRLPPLLAPALLLLMTPSTTCLSITHPTTKKRLFFAPAPSAAALSAQTPHRGRPAPTLQRAVPRPACSSVVLLRERVQHVLRERGREKLIYFRVCVEDLV